MEKEYPAEQGWERDYKDPMVPGRKFDHGNPETREAVEDKSGKMDPSQYGKDVDFLEKGGKLTIRFKEEPGNADRKTLEELRQRFPGRFNYQVGPGE